jgi:large subunit ribosomal protein L15
MKLENLPKTTRRDQKRVGRGLGSGKGKTAGRGHKGQKARGRIPFGFTGGTLALYKRLPYRRGIGNRQGFSNALTINLSKLIEFSAKEEINVESLIKAGLLDARSAKIRGVKIVGNSAIKEALTINLPVSKSVKEIIEKAGGKVISG